jgi:multicomponent Na+:H+ antiporter subunit G
MTHAIGLALTGAGTAVVALAVVSAVVVRGDVFNRLHLVTPVTSVGGPLIAVGLCIDSGQPWVMAEVLFITLMLFFSGPVLESATGRVAAQRRGLVDEEQPE